MYAPPQHSQQQQGFGAGNQQQYAQHMHQPAGLGGEQQPWGQFGMMNDATAQMGMQFGRSAVIAGQDYVNKNVRVSHTASVGLC